MMQAFVHQSVFDTAQKVPFDGYNDLSDNLLRLFQQFLDLEIPVALTELLQQLLPLHFLIPATIELLQTHQQPFAFINGHASPINHRTLQQHQPFRLSEIQVVRNSGMRLTKLPPHFEFRQMRE